MNEALKMIADKVQNNPALKAKLAAELKAAAEKEQDAAKRDARVSAAKNALGIDIAAAAAQPKPEQTTAEAAIPSDTISGILAMLLGK